jgi:preprotein translocase subunit YajC
MIMAATVSNPGSGSRNVIDPPRGIAQNAVFFPDTSTEDERMKTANAWIWLLTVALVVAMPAWSQPKTDDKASPAVQPAPSEEEGFEDVGTPSEEKKDASSAEDNDKEGTDKKEGESETEKKKPKSSNPFGGPFIWIMLGAVVLMFIFSSRGRKKQEAKRREMIENLTKGDRIVTIGGIVGTVAEIRDDEIIVKVEDSTRMKFARWAIRTVGEEVKDDKKKNSQEEK